MAIASDVGTCIEGCDYTITLGGYRDSCSESGDAFCQPLGLTLAPVCLHRDEEHMLEVGEPGCDPVFAPCVPAAICLDVVCRALCWPGQAPCDDGFACAPLAGRNDIYYCENR